jgi:hypothetical protein
MLLHSVPTTTTTKRGRKRGLSEENKVTDEPLHIVTQQQQNRNHNGNNNNNNNNNNHRKSRNKETPTKSLINLMKRQRFSRTAGQLRLEQDVKECRKRITTGIVEVYHERQDMDTVNILIRRIFPQVDGSAPFRHVQFVAHAPKYYPHKPLQLCLKEIPEFPLSNTFSISQDRERIVTFPMIGDGWNPVYSLYDVVIHLACLVYEDQRGGDDQGGEMELDQVGTNVSFCLFFFF